MLDLSAPKLLIPDQFDDKQVTKATRNNTKEHQTQPNTTKQQQKININKQQQTTTNNKITPNRIKKY